MESEETPSHHEAGSMIDSENSHAPSSAGTKADLEAGVDIAEVLGGYFSSPEAARSFIECGIEGTLEQELPQDVTYADFGGGQGFLTKKIADHLRSQGHRVEAWVVDGNDKYLEEARKQGLRTQLANLESSTFRDADLITMRAVNHYNSSEKQAEIILNTSQALKKGGFLVSQISSGSEENCELRSRIVNLESLRRAAPDAQYHWTSVAEYTAKLEKAGFKDNALVGHAPDAQWTPEEQWDRFHDKELQEAISANDHERVNAITEVRKKFLRESYDLIDEYLQRYTKEGLGVNFNKDNQAVIRYQYPILRSRKE